MDGLELLQTLNLANMNLTIQAIFQWFQKKVGSLGSRLEAYADGVSENRPNASKWNFRNPAPFTTQRHSPEATSGLSGGLARLPLTKGNFTVSIYNATHQISTNWSSIPTPHASSRIRSQSATQELRGFQSNSPSYPRIQVHGSTTYNLYCKPLMIPTQAYCSGPPPCCARRSQSSMFTSSMTKCAYICTNCRKAV